MDQGIIERRQILHHGLVGDVREEVVEFDVAHSAQSGLATPVHEGRALTEHRKVLEQCYNCGGRNEEVIKYILSTYVRPFF